MTRSYILIIKDDNGNIEERVVYGYSLTSILSELDIDINIIGIK